MNFFQIARTPLFAGTTEEETKHMLTCLKAVEKTYKKGETIYCAGDVITEVGLVLSGSVLIENVDVWGNCSVLDKVGEGKIFAESYACIPGERLMVSVTAAETSDILFLDVTKMLLICSNACSFHQKLLRNLLSVSAQKNLRLSRRIFNTSAKSIRGRLLSYLSYEAMQHACREFDIPYNRQQLADYLSVDRSAMSNELGKMQREGLIRVKRNHFYILNTEQV